MGVLGSMLLSQEAGYLARERLSEQSFYRLAHQDIFSAIVRLSDEQNAVDTILLRDELARQEKLDKAGGVAYLLELMEAVPTSANVEHYIEIVRDHAIRRQLIDTAARVEVEAFEPGRQVDDLLDEAESTILSVRHQKDASGIREVTDVLQDVIGKLEELHQHPGQLTGLPSGYYDLDDITGGFQPGDFIVVAARPSMGKTTLSLNILHHICAVQRRPAAIYSLEMPAEQIVSNFMCIHNRLDTHAFRRGTLRDKDWSILEESLDELVGLPLYIDDTASMRVLDLRARARRLAHRHNVELIVVDYLQLLTANSSRDNRANEVAEISRGIKALARELRVPVIAVAQLSRRVEQEQRRPRLSDLRESGAIEQDADLVLLLHRAQDFEESPEGGAEAGTEADLIVAKHRNGPTGMVPLVFQKRFLRFESRATQQRAGSVPANG
jgi:replicative DNA helicase